MNNTTKQLILAAASEPNSGIKFDGDYIEYDGKEYWVNLALEQVMFIRNVEG